MSDRVNTPGDASAADAPVLSLRGVTFAHPRGPRVLAYVDLDLRPGERVALLGANGCGKTTLLRLLVALAAPDSGRVLLDGREVGTGRRDREALRRAVQMVLPEPDDQVFAASVRADVSFGPANAAAAAGRRDRGGIDRAEIHRVVDDAMAEVGVSDLADRPPHLLSTGQRKRVALAGVLAMHPRVLLLDEPTAGLDPVATRDLVATLDARARDGAAVLMATHDVDLVWAWADEVVVLSGGRVVRGPTHRLLTDRDLLERSRLTPPWGAVVSALLGRTVRDPGGV